MQQIMHGFMDQPKIFEWMLKNEMVKNLARDFFQSSFK